MQNSNRSNRKSSSKPTGKGKNFGDKPTRGKSEHSKSKAPLAKRSQKPTKPALANNSPKPIKSDDIRLNKYISNSGVCSRREADVYIQSGNVKVNGQVIVELGYKVKPGDVVTFDGSTLKPEKKEYILLNKPKNFTTSGEDSGSAHNVLELLKSATRTKLQPIGRMDKSTTGLLILTNDTDLILKFSKPQQKSTKIYQVSLDRNLKFEDLESIAAGVTLDGHRIYADEVSYIENQPKTEIGIQLRTANVKVVRAIFENFKYDVLKVDRVSFAGLTKKNLPRGFFRHLTDQEIINLKNI